MFPTDLYLGDPYYDLAYLDIQVRPVSETTWVSLSPRQTLDAVPYARTLDHESGGYAATRIHTGVDGVHISSAGDDGVEVEYADYYGLWVRMADYGVVISEAVDDGVHVALAGDIGVYANTTRTAGDYGLYTPDRIYGSNLTTTSLSLIAQVTGDQALAPGDVVSAVGLADPLRDSIQHMPQVAMAAGHITDNVVGVVESALVLVPKPQREDDERDEEPVLQLKYVEGPAQPGAYVAMIVLGVAEVKIDPDSKASILPGQRLTASQVGGHARNLRTELLNDMVVSEGAPVLGIALAEPGPDRDTIPVFVTLR